MKRYYLFLILSLFLVTCTSDDDICTSGEATPRLKIKFRDTENKIYRISQIFVDADYGNGMVNVVEAKNVDSVLVPLRVDDSPFTKLQIRETADGESSTILINYNTKSEYVSPACGVKRLYENIDGTLEKPNPVVQIQKLQNEIYNESQTHFYFIFNP